MAVHRFAGRRAKLLAKIKQTEAEAILVTSVTNVSYLTGFTGDSSVLVLGKGITILISDSRYETQLQEECPGLETFIRKATFPMREAVGKVIGKAKLSSLAFEAGCLTFADWEAYQKELEMTKLVPTTGLVEELRSIKDVEEIAETRVAVRLAEKGFATLRAGLRPEMTEREVAHDLEHAMRRFGARGAAFSPIIAVGPRAALPHARAAGSRIDESGFVLVDWGADSPLGYKSDLTRVLITGKVPAKLEKIYRVVLEAQRAGIAAIRPGAVAKEVDAIARKVIEDAGFGKNFGHSLGHGIGLDIHEQPRLSGSSDQVLQPGMIVTVEPGIYLAGWGGVRIEDDVLVTPDGHEVLTSVPKEWETAFC